MSGSNPNTAPIPNDPNRPPIPVRLAGHIIGAAQHASMEHHAQVVETMSRRQALYADLSRIALTSETRIDQATASERLDEFAASYGKPTRGNETKPLPTPMAESPVMDRIKTAGIPLNFGEFAATPTVSGKTAKAQNVLEKWREWRINHRAAIKNKADVTAFRELRTFAVPKKVGGKDVQPTLGDYIGQPDGHSRTRIANKLFGRVSGKRFDTPDHSLTTRYREHRYGSDQLTGTSKKTRRSQKYTVEIDKLKGELDGFEARTARTNINAQPPKHGEKIFQGLGRKQRRANKKLRQVSDQVFLSQYRQYRLNRSSRKLQKMQHNYETSTGKTIKSKRVNRSLAFIEDTIDLRTKRQRKDGIVTRDVRLSGRSAESSLGRPSQAEQNAQKAAAAASPLEITAQKRKEREMAEMRAKVEARYAAQQGKIRKAEKAQAEGALKRQRELEQAVVNPNDPKWMQDAQKVMATITETQQHELRRVDREVYEALNGVDEADWYRIRKGIYEKHYGPMDDKQASEMFAVIRTMSVMAEREAQSKQKQPESPEANETVPQPTETTSSEELDEEKIYKIAVKYIAGLGRKGKNTGTPFPAMSDLSLINELAGHGIDEATARSLYQEFQEKGYISTHHTRGVGFAVLKSQKEFDKIIKQIDG